jgi:hypothetical protein
MIPKGLFTDIALIAITVGIAFTYLKPSYETISANQDTIATYQTELTKVQAVNDRLQVLQSERQLVASSSERSLYRFLPQSVDEISVRRDLLAVLRQFSIIPTALTAGSGDDRSSARTPVAVPVSDENALADLVPHAFSINAQMSYDTLKRLLAAFALNDYPLVVTELSVTAVEAGVGDDDGALPNMVGVTLTLTTYTMAMNTKSDEANPDSL